MQDPKDLRRNKAELALDEIARASSEDIRSFHLRWDETVINLETEGVLWTDDHMLRRYMIAIGEDTAKWVKLHVDPQTVGTARKAAERWQAAETLFGKPWKNALELPGVSARTQRQRGALGGANVNGHVNLQQQTFGPAWQASVFPPGRRSGARPCGNAHS